MACFRLFTFLPLLPLLSVPRLRLRIARSTSFEALREYRRAMVLLRRDPTETTANRRYLFQCAYAELGTLRAVRRFVR